ncbi:MAG: ABC transporter substrate-binding protein [Chloroflexi bacterium]|nr:ABC transporter substrate-binding protein [Chloroflexota bacterium]
MTRRRQFAWLSAVVGGAAAVACGGEEAAKPAAPAAKAEPTKAPEPTKAAVAPAAPTAAPAPAAAPVKITWFAGRDLTGFSVKQVEEFNKQAGGKITLDYQEQGQQTSDLRDKFILVANAKDPSADVVSMDVPFVPEFAAAGWTLDAEKVLFGDDRTKFYKGTLDGATYLGKLFAVPWYNNGPGLYYRKDLVEQGGFKGPPKSYDELLEQAKKLRTADIQGFSAQMSQTEGGIITWFEYLWGHGGDLMDEKLEVTLDKGTAGVDSFKRLLAFMYTDKILPEGALGYKTGADAQNPFIEGKSVFLRQWTSGLTQNDRDDSKIKGKWDVVPLPSLKGDKAGAGCLGTWNLGTSKFSKNPDQSGEVIRWFTSQAQQKARYLAMGVPPCRPAVFDDAEVKAKYAFADKLKVTFESLKPRPVTPFYGQMSANVIQPVFGKVTTRAVTPEEGIKEMADGMRKIMKG